MLSPCVLPALADDGALTRTAVVILSYKAYSRFLFILCAASMTSLMRLIGHATWLYIVFIKAL